MKPGPHGCVNDTLANFSWLVWKRQLSLPLAAAGSPRGEGVYHNTSPLQSDARHHAHSQ